MTRPITPEDLWRLARVGQPEPLPDGRQAVVPVRHHDLATNEGLTQLHLVGLDGEVRPLTRGTSSAEHPIVDPSGTRVAFVRKPSPENEPQLHVMPLSAGEAEPVTDLPLGAGPAQWLPDGSGLIVAVPLLRGHPSLDATAEERDRRREDPVRAVVTEDRIYRYWNRWLVGGRMHHLFHLDLATGELRDLTPAWDRLLSTEPDPAGAFAVSPDGETVGVSADVSEPPHDRFQFAIHLVDLRGDGEPRLLSEELPAHQRRPRFTPDGRILYGVQIEQDFYADRVRLAIADPATGESRILTEDWDRSAGGWEITSEGGVVRAAEDEGRTRLFLTDLDGAEPKPLTETGSWHGPRPAGDVVWCRHESAAAPPDVAVVDDGGPRRLELFNRELLAELDLGRVEELTVTGAGRDPVHVQVVYPPGFDPSRRWPLLHNVHGGPHGLVADSWHWRWNTQVFAATGRIVASVNFHGSSSWGDAFTRSIQGAWGDKPATDVLAATDHLVAQGFVDEGRMAIAGGSYGGYLVTWLTTVTDRFACAVCHAGVTDLLGQWASDITAGREHSVGGTPWEDMDAVLRWSPLAHTEQLVTPTLVVHGELDYRVVVTQGLTLYGILKDKGVPARLVYYPDEGHWIEKPRNSLLWYDEVLGWIDRWTGDQEAAATTTSAITTGLPARE